MISILYDQDFHVMVWARPAELHEIARRIIEFNDCEEDEFEIQGDLTTHLRHFAALRLVRAEGPVGISFTATRGIVLTGSIQPLSQFAHSHVLKLGDNDSHVHIRWLKEWTSDIDIIFGVSNTQPADATLDDFKIDFAQAREAWLRQEKLA